MFSLNRCDGSCNTIDDPSSTICVPNKRGDKNLNIFNMITGINESKALVNHISCSFRCKFDGKNRILIKSEIWTCVDVSVKLQ